jgi:predicted Rossmann-fold nucleotide-binding protein
VFGGTDDAAMKSAVFLGQMITEVGAVLLTGGRGPEGDGSAAVRGAAIEGAMKVPLDRASWVEVERNPTVSDAEVKQTHVILHVGFGHRRNYVEASLCDVAIVLPGEEGTASELAFSLALDRPVMLVGDYWTAVSAGVVHDPAVTARGLLTAVDHRVGLEDSGEPWHEDITLACARLARADLFPADMTPRPLPQSERDAQDIVETALHAVTRDDLPGAFPPSSVLTSPQHAEMARIYEDWLAGRPPFEWPGPHTDR